VLRSAVKRFKALPLISGRSEDSWSTYCCT
jgi:hypothetical protein